MNRFTPYSTFLLLLSAVLVLASITLCLSSKWQDAVSGFLYPEQRTLLASLETSLNIKDQTYKILKIKSNKKIWIEIYNLNKPSNHAVSFSIDSKADGQMFLNGKTSPLFASDLDGDSILEIVVPSFGLEFQPQVHAFQLDPKNGDFFKIPTEKLIKLL